VSLGFKVLARDDHAGGGKPGAGAEVHIIMIEV
jgi:hypothetical protein